MYFCSVCVCAWPTACNCHPSFAGVLLCQLFGLLWCFQMQLLVNFCVWNKCIVWTKLIPGRGQCPKICWEEAGQCPFGRRESGLGRIVKVCILLWKTMHCILSQGSVWKSKHNGCITFYEWTLYDSPWSPLVVSSSAFPLLDILIKLLLQTQEPDFSLGIWHLFSSSVSLQPVSCLLGRRLFGTQVFT